MQTYYTDSSP